MGDADKAYAAAEAEIARVKAAGETQLDFSTPRFRALSTLPPEIAGLKALRSLDLENTQVTNLDPIAGLTVLKSLRLTKTPVTTLDRIVGLTALEWLFLDDTQITSLDLIAKMTALEWLDLKNTQTTSLAPIAGLTALERLDLRNTGIADLRPIRALYSLASPETIGLTFENTPFASATPETRRLASIADHKERTRETLAFLNTLPPPPAPLPWEVGGTSAAQPDPTVKTAETQINTLLKKRPVDPHHGGSVRRPDRNRPARRPGHPWQPARAAPADHGRIRRGPPPPCRP